MRGKQGADTLIYFDAQLLRTIDDEVLPFAGTNFH
jgi:hypothetical protein